MKPKRIRSKKKALVFAHQFDAIVKSGDFATLSPPDHLFRVAAQASNRMTLEETPDQFIFTLFKRK